MHRLLVALATGYLLAAPLVGRAQSITVANSGFETPSVGGGYVYYRQGGLSIADQGGAGWSMSEGGTGFAANGSAFNVIGAFGNQAAFLQNETFLGRPRPRIWQELTGFLPGVAYQLTFYSEYRNAYAGGNPLSVTVGGQVLEIGGENVFLPVSGTSFNLMTSNPFSAATGTMTLSFEGVFAGTTDRTTFIDNVAISQWVQPGTYWAPGSGAGGNGTWNIDNTVWSSVSDGNSGKASWTQYSQANVARFGGTAGSVAVSGTVSVNQMYFDTTGYTLTGGSGNAVLFNGYQPKVQLSGNASSTIAAAIQSTGGLSVTGSGSRGTLILAGTSTYTGTTTVSNAVLRVNGSLGKTNVVLGAGATLGGSGVISGTVSGAGLVAPGNSPGILTAAAVDPSGGTDFTFEFSGTAPNYTSGTASINDVLRLTGTTPFGAALTSANTKTLFLNVTKDQLSLGTILKGGFFTDVDTDFTSFLNNVYTDNAGFAVYVLGDGQGTDNSLNGQGYYNWRNPAMFGWDQSLFLSTTAETADFGAGAVNGRVMTLVVAVPEPSTYAMGLAGAGFLGLMQWSRRRRRTRRTAG